MNNSKLRKLTNNYQDVRLVSLKDWKAASEVSPRDQGGPYIIAQECYAPQDLSCRLDEFVLSRSGKWLPTGLFFSLPLAERRSDFVFGTMSEVAQLLYSLPAQASVWGAPLGEEVHPSPLSDQDELNSVFKGMSKSVSN